jgi:sugar phosphate isomerase/epimerase
MGRTRRKFLKMAGACVLGSTGTDLIGAQVFPFVKADPEGTHLGSNLPRLLSGCSAFSFRRQLTDGQMTLEDFIRRAVELRLDGVDMTLYYLKSTDPGYLESLRYLAYKNAVVFLGAACRSGTVQVDPTKREAVLSDIKKWVDVTGWLGAPQLRVMGGPAPPGVSLGHAIDSVVEIMKAATDYSAKKGIVLALENSRGVSQTSDACLEVMQRVASPYAGITLDITHFVPTPSQDAYAQIAACIPYATNAHIMDCFDDGAPIDLERIWKIFADAGFKGHMSLEYVPKLGTPDKSSTDIPQLISQIRALCRKYSSAAS